MKSFEERLKKLEEIAESIQSADIPLEEALSRFEEGIKLARGLEKEIGKIERKIEILKNEPDPNKPGDSPELELFPELTQQEGNTKTAEE